MAGKPKEGLDYAGWSVYMFDGDTQIDRLLEAQGWIGFCIYFYLCQMAYKFKGYFYQWSYADSVTTARRMGGGVKSETVKQTVGLCLQIGLFDKRLFDRDGILTSRGIQRRYYEAIQKRRRKIVIADYWLLDEREYGGLEMCAANSDLQPANSDSRQANGDSHPANSPKSKVKKSKVNDPPVTPPNGGWGFGEELDSAFSLWLSYKIEKRHPCTPTELDCLTAQVREQARIHGEKAVADLILLSASNGWTGIAWGELNRQRGMGGHSRSGSGTLHDNPSSVRDEMARMEKYLQELRGQNKDGEL